MTQLAHGLTPLPTHFHKLPLDHRGYPVPKFVWQKPDGTYDFRVIKPGWPQKVVREKLCWLCGTPLTGKISKRHPDMVFVIGSMCSLTKNLGEPNHSHLSCARWAAANCPFLRFPNRKRDEHDMPEDGFKPGGEEAMIMRNPGVTCLWTTRSFKPYRANDGTTLYELGDPIAVEWWSHGRRATREEIMHSIHTGLPILRAMAERDGPEAIKELEDMTAEGLKLVPAA